MKLQIWVNDVCEIGCKEIKRGRSRAEVVLERREEEEEDERLIVTERICELPAVKEPEREGESRRQG